MTDRRHDRRGARAVWGWAHRALCCVLLAAPGPVAGGAAGAADAPPAPAESEAAPDDAAVAASLMISPSAAARQRRAECDAARSRGEMVVCGADRGEQWRVPSTAESDPKSRAGTNNGMLHAPNVSSLPDCAIVKCHGFGKVPPPIYVVDFSKLPQAPAGSDADRIAKGEMPAP